MMSALSIRPGRFAFVVVSIWLASDRRKGVAYWVSTGSITSFCSSTHNIHTLLLIFSNA